MYVCIWAMYFQLLFILLVYIFQLLHGKIYDLVQIFNSYFLASRDFMSGELMSQP